MSTLQEFLIDEWFPINEVSVESVRERSVGQNPAPNRLHVWFARRPLTTSRATIIMSLLKNGDRKEILKILGIPYDKDVLAAQKAIQETKISKRKISNPFTWERAFKHTPTSEESTWLQQQLKNSWNGKIPTVLDPMAGGGSIPYEAVRLGLPTISGDLNPVAFLILKATVEYPAKFREKLIPSIEAFCKEIHELAKKDLEEFFPMESPEKVQSYLWVRTIKCSSCNLVIPMSPNWWLVREEKPTDVAVRIITPKSEDECSFEIIENPIAKGYDPDKGTDIGKEAICPRCNTPTDGEIVKKIAQEGGMGHKLYAVCTKIPTSAKKSRWHFRTPTKNELKMITKAEEELTKKIKEWEKSGLITNEDFPENANDTRPLQYGMKKWKDFFNTRQLLTHSIYLEKFLKVKNKWLRDKEFGEAISVYGAMVFDTCINYNSILCRWAPDRIIIKGTMDMQAFPFKTSYAEWNQLIENGGFEWATSKIIDAVNELVKLLPSQTLSPVIYNSDSASMPLEDKSMESIIVDPPYHDNVMYSDMSDFFYVWLKRLVGDLFPESFKNELTNKMDEATANSALYRDMENSKDLGNQHYRAKMQASFKEMNRVLKDNGILTVMFTHRKVEAWAELTRALMEAGFTFRSSWPVFTEPGQKFGKADKGALKVTIILSCRKRRGDKPGLWSEVERELQEEAERVVHDHAKHGISGMDLLVSAYGPILGKFADYSLIKDEYRNIIGPEQALDLVSETVNKYNTQDIVGADFDTLSYINLLKNFPMLTVEEDLARVTTVFGGKRNIKDLEKKGGKGMLEKKSGKITILLSKDRLANGHIDIKKPETLVSIIDVVHAALRVYENQGMAAVKELLTNTGRDAADSGFISVLKVIASFVMNGAGKKLSDEASTARLLLQALGYEPESVLKKGARISHYFAGQTKFTEDGKLVGDTDVTSYKK